MVDRVPDRKKVATVESVEESAAAPLRSGTAHDRNDMARIGEEQELLRNYQFLSVLAFTTVILATWETVLYTISYASIDGGLPGLVWVFVVASVGMGTVVLSLAEMASMAPTSGGQYHWASEFAPPEIQKFLSFMTGGSYLTASQIQALLLLNGFSYGFQRWHGTLLIIAVVAVAIFFNIFLAKQLPRIEILMLVLHTLGFVANIVPLWVLGPRTPARAVFTEFQNNGGWPNQGLSALIGLTGPVFSLIASDCAVHMERLALTDPRSAEEIRDASRVLPLGVVWSIFISIITGFVMVLTICFAVDDIESVLSSPTGQPYIQIFFNTTGSRAGTSAMTAVIATMTLCNAVNNVASASRQLYAFARDRGLPFSGFLSQVHPHRAIPLNSLLVCSLTTCLLSLINIGSAIAFNAIVSLGAAALFSTYFISIACVLGRRCGGEPLRPGRWSLGPRDGALANVAALAFLALFYFFSFWLLFNARGQGDDELERGHLQDRGAVRAGVLLGEGKGGV
ncbi:MAG: hypothetical protein Q9173_003943 [Seirophora scorigena]